MDTGAFFVDTPNTSYINGAKSDNQPGRFDLTFGDTGTFRVGYMDAPDHSRFIEPHKPLALCPSRHFRLIGSCYMHLIVRLFMGVVVDGLEAPQPPLPM
jgi:hypothetical protein